MEVVFVALSSCAYQWISRKEFNSVSREYPHHFTRGVKMHYHYIFDVPKFCHRMCRYSEATNIDFIP